MMPNSILLYIWDLSLFCYSIFDIICFSFRQKLFKIVNDCVYSHYRVGLDKVAAAYIPEDEKLSNEHIKNIFFGNYMEPDADPKIYDQVFL